MTGPEHYRTAEDLLHSLGEVEAGSVTEMSRIAEAQVHATLALAAATALTPGGPVSASRNEWVRAVAEL